MKYDQVLIRFGDFMLKGKNRYIFIKKTLQLIEQNIKDLNVELIKKHDRVYLKLNDVETQTIEERLLRVSGIASFSFVKIAEKNLESIIEVGVELLNSRLEDGTKFKIETKRADKRFYLTSQQVTLEVAPKIIPQIKKKFSVDVRNPDVILQIEIRDEAVYLFLGSTKGLGGFPVGVAGKALSLLSGGIDSPVATFLAMKQGVLVEGIHFESTPLTAIESAQKVIDLAKKLALYAPHHQFNVLMVPFTEIHQEILKSIPNPYIITIMRRVMFKIAELLAIENNAYAVITGESVGQVASQTLPSLQTIEAVIKLPVLRPVLTYDKQEIINLARELDLYEISIRPFADCCSIYVPKNPATKPTEKRALQYERYLNNLDSLIEKAVQETSRWTIKPDTDLELNNYGFTVKEAWEVIKHD